MILLYHMLCIPQAAQQLSICHSPWSAWQMLLQRSPERWYHCCLVEVRCWKGCLWFWVLYGFVMLMRSDWCSGCSCCLMFRTLSWHIWTKWPVTSAMRVLKMILPNCSYQFVHPVDTTFKCPPATPSSSSLLAGGNGLIYLISATLQLTALFCDEPFEGKCSMAVALGVWWLLFAAAVISLWEGHGLSGEHLKQQGYQ